MKPVGRPESRLRKAVKVIVAIAALYLIGKTAVTLLAGAVSTSQGWKVLLDPVILIMILISPTLFQIIAKPLREIDARQRQMDQALEVERRNLKTIFDASPIGMMLLDESLVVQHVNQALSHVTGVSMQGMTDRYMNVAMGCERIHSQAFPCCTRHSTCHIFEAIESVLKKQKAVYDLEVQFKPRHTPNMPVIRLLLNVIPVHIQGRLNVLVSMQDITLRYENEQRIKEARDQAEQARLDLEEAAECARVLADEAVAANVAKSEFLSNMSHEIRTPMNTIVGFSDVLMDEALTDRQHKYVEVIQRSSDHLLTLINDVLDFSKIEADKLVTEHIQCELSDLLYDLQQQFEEQCRIRNLSFKVICDEHVPDVIWTDPTRLKQCLFNLIGNAMKFTKSGYIHVSVSKKPFNDQPGICISVEDTGIGIPEDKQQAIFEAFTQADAATTRQYGGTGLGLAITKRLVTLLDGQLTCHSVPGRGSLFSINLPVDTAWNTRSLKQGLDQFQQADRTGQMECKKEDVSGAGIRVLVAEDCPGNQFLIQTIFHGQGYDLTIVDNGQAVIDQVTQESYDLILMDMHMPVLSGFDAVRQLRQLGMDVPIIAVTADAVRDAEGKCLAAGCNDYITKPINRNLLMQKIQELTKPILHAAHVQGDN